jgi:hypothetical protein
LKKKPSHEPEELAELPKIPLLILSRWASALERMAE